MKLSLLFSTLLCLAFFTGCSKDDSSNNVVIFEATGTLEGSDKGLCPCCGGYVLTIDGDDGNYRVEQLPTGSDITLDETIKNVQFDWSLDRECGGIRYLTIQAIELY